MIDLRQFPERGGTSVIELSLARLLENRAPRRFVLAEGFAFHGRGGSVGAEPEVDRPAGDRAGSAFSTPPADPAGAAASATPAAPSGEPGADSAPPGGGLAGLLERGAARLDAAREAYRESCRLAAVQARELAAFAAWRPAAALDRPDAEVGAAAAASRAARPGALTAVSEWAVDEVMVALCLSGPAASRLLAESVTLVQRLPGTLAALEEGRIGPAHARMLVEVLGPVPEGARGRLEARLLARAAGKTVPQLRAAAHRAVLRDDAAGAARRAARAIRERSVRACPGRDGMGSLTTAMPLPLLTACYQALRRYAQDCVVPGDLRTLEQRMVDCLADLILRPGETGLPPVQVQLTVVAGVDTLTGGDEPGEIDGQPIPAAMVRELAYALGLLPRPHPHDTAAPADTDRAAGTNSDTDPDTDAPADDADAADRNADDATARIDETATADPDPDPEAADDADADEDVYADDASACVDVDPGVRADGAAPGAAAPDVDAGAGGSTAAHLARLLDLRSIAGTALAHLPRIAVVDQLTGQLLALTTAAAIRAAATCSHAACRTARRPCTHPPAGPGLGPPPDTTGYRPAAPLDAFVRTRDRRCRFPGCRAAAIRCDLDHATPWPAGPTSADNLCCLCRHHHRLSHQAPGWRMRLLPDGTLEWTTPGGDRITTRPPAHGTDDPPPTPPEHAPHTLRESILGRPAEPDDEPAPF